MLLLIIIIMNTMDWTTPYSRSFTRITVIQALQAGVDISNKIESKNREMGSETPTRKQTLPQVGKRYKISMHAMHHRAHSLTHLSTRYAKRVTEYRYVRDTRS